MIRVLFMFALLAAATTPVFGAPFTQTAQPLTVLGDVPVRCKMLPPQTSGNGLNINFSQNSAGGEIAFTDFVDPDTGKMKAASARLLFPITCTGAQTLTVTTQNGGLTNTNVSGTTAGFAARGDYTLDASWANTTRSLRTAGSPASLDLSQSAPESGELVLNFTLAAGSEPLEAGSYEDAIVVQLNTAQ
jgi:hypothetical protein